MRALPLAVALGISLASSGAAQDHPRVHPSPGSGGGGATHPCDQSAPTPALSALPDRPPRVADAGGTIARAATLLAGPTADPSRPAALFELAEAYRSRDDREAAIRTLATLVRDHPDWSGMDEVLYRLATALSAMQQQDRARQVFMRLIRDYPTSPYIQASYLAFADYYFAEGDYQAARQFSERALAFSGPADAYARYRHAWTLAGLGDSSALAELDRARSQASAATQLGGGEIARAVAQDRSALDRWARCAR